MNRPQKKLFILLITLFTIFSSTIVLAAENEEALYLRWFRTATEVVEIYFDWIVSLVSGFYDEYGAVGMIVALFALCVAIAVLIYIIRLLKFLFYNIKRFFFIITGIEKRRRKKEEKRRKDAKTLKVNYNNLIKWNDTSASHGGMEHWEAEVAKVVEEINTSRAAQREEDEKMWQDMISGEIPYSDKLNDIEKRLFSFEDRIHAIIGKITSMPKKDIVVETARLRIGFESLSRDMAYLIKLQESFPEDTNISSLAELCEAFIQATKGLEKGFIAALTG